MIANALAYKKAVKAVRDTLIQYEHVFAAVAAQIDGARFCRDLLAKIDEALDGAPEVPLTLEEAAEASGYSSEHLRRLIREGHLATYRATGERKHLVLLSQVPTRIRGARSAQPAPEQLATHSHERSLVAPVSVPAPALAPKTTTSYDATADARSVLARVRGGKF